MTKDMNKLILICLIVFLFVTTVACNDTEKLDKLDNLIPHETENTQIIKESNDDFVENTNEEDPSQEESIMDDDEEVTIYDRWANVKPIEKKEYWNGTIEDSFNNETILIVIDQAFTNKVFTIDDFKNLGLDIVEVKWLSKIDRYAENNSWPDYWHQTYEITIGNEGKQNVLDAMKIIAELDFVMAASPNGVMYAQNSWKYKFPN